MNPDDPSAWARLAEDDWHLAVSLLRRKKLPIQGICFHAQQSAEKYLKAVLVSRRVYFPKTHDLVFLNQLCEQSGILSGFAVEDLALLTDFAVQVRYPGEEPDETDARRAVEIARSVRGFARRWLGM
ncbi:MAG: HEPN domain-containing protein [Chloroflexota bacterium]